MTTPNPTENTLQPGALQNANSDASQAAGAGASQGRESDMPEWFKPYAKQIEQNANIVRSKQSEADKAVAAANKSVKKNYLEEIEPFVQQAARVGGWTAEQAEAFRQNMAQAEVQRRVLSSGDETVATPVSQGSGAGPAAQIGEWDVLQLFGVKETDEGVMDALREANGDARKLHAALLSRQVSATAKPQPTPASNAAIAGGSPLPGVPTPEQLTAAYQRDMLAARGNPTLLKQIEATARKNGVPVDSIVFV